MSPYASRLTRTLPAIAALAALLGLGGCISSGGYDTFAYHEIHEIPQGSGLVTDDSGEFTVIERDWGSSGAAGSTRSAEVPAVHTSGGITEASTPE